MINLVLYICMIFMHFIGDVYLQGNSLSNAKRREYWKIVEQRTGIKHPYSHICFLMLHSFLWSFTTLLPILLKIIFYKILIISGLIPEPSSFQNLILFYLTAIAANTLAHGFIDNAKSNLKQIGEIQDQILHIIQITITFILYIKLV